jgi:protein-tyrosine kinase
MSRVFDALQEAARRRGANGGAVDAVWTEMGISSTELPKVESNGGAAGNGTATAIAPAGTAEDLEILPETLDREVTLASPTSPEGATAPDRALALDRASAPDRVSAPDGGSAPEKAAARIHLDKGARLIPHTTDRVVVERYRMLRTKILQERERKFFRSLVVTSASPQEGKTVTALNLALSFAALPSFKVLVIDGDMRKGTLGEWLGVDGDRPGLSNLLDGSATLEQVLLKSDELSMWVLPRGNARVWDLQPSQFEAHFRPVTEHFDLILVDTPPVNLVTDVQIMAASCDAVLLIARAFSTTNKSIEEATDKLQPFRIIGTVLNAGTPRSAHKYRGYY